MATPTTLPASFTSGQVLTAAQMNNLRGAFRVLQVAQATKTDTFTTTSTSYVDVTGLTISITPSSTSSKILVFADVKISSTVGAGNAPVVQIVRDSTAIYNGAAAGNRTVGTYGFNAESGDLNRYIGASGSCYLDSPNTTSATTYKIQMRQGGGGTGSVNQAGGDSNFNGWVRTASSITVMEISA